VLSLSDRVAVLYEGRVVGLEDARSADVNRIGLLMTGGTLEEQPADEGGRAATSQRAEG
jgi:simple sugar transport system ATP-binding protein